MNRIEKTNCDVVLVGSLGLNNQSVGRKRRNEIGERFFLLNKKEYYEKLDTSYKTKSFSTNYAKKIVLKKLRAKKILLFPQFDLKPR